MIKKFVTNPYALLVIMFYDIIGFLSMFSEELDTKVQYNFSAYDFLSRLLLIGICIHLIEEIRQMKEDYTNQKNEFSDYYSESKKSIDELQVALNRSFDKIKEDTAKALEAVKQESIWEVQKP